MAITKDEGVVDSSSISALISIVIGEVAFELAAAFFASTIARSLNFDVCLF